MNRCSIVLTFLLLISPAVFAQRGGRADALQNYLGRNQNPRILLQVKYQKARLYFRFLDLQKKTRSTVTLTDPSTGQSHAYEGVRIEDLAPGGVLNHDSGSLEISAEHKKKVTVLCSAVDFKTPPIVADTVDGGTTDRLCAVLFCCAGARGVFRFAPECELGRGQTIDARA